MAEARYYALNCPAYVNGKDVLLAVRKDPDPERRRIIVMYPHEAAGLWKQGRLDGWEPDGEAAR